MVAHPHRNNKVSSQVEVDEGSQIQDDANSSTDSSQVAGDE